MSRCRNKYKHRKKTRGVVGVKELMKGLKRMVGMTALL